MRRSTLVLGTLLCACAAHAHTHEYEYEGGQAHVPQVQPFRSVEDTRALAEEESRVWAEARDFDRALRNFNFIHGDQALRQYLQGLMDRLYPEMQGSIRVRVGMDPVMNAFALPNGSVYVNMGLIARMDNEAQLVSVLAHEGAHFVHRHGFQQRNTLKSSTAAAVVLGTLGGIYGSILGNFAAASSVFGHSREMETEADRIAIERMRALGYDVSAVLGLFESLKEEAALLEIKEPLIFASHPKLEERVESVKQTLSEAAHGGKLEGEAFLRRTQVLRIEWMQAELAVGRYKSLIHVLSNPAAAAKYGPTHAYYLGEAYRLRNEEGDVQKAEEAYLQSIAAVPDFAPAWRAMGMSLMKRGERVAAREHFERFLELTSASAEAEYVKHYLSELAAEPAPQTLVTTKESP